MNQKYLKAQRRIERGNARPEDIAKVAHIEHLAAVKALNQPKFDEPRTNKPTKVRLKGVGRNADGTRREWRAGQPTHVLKPVRYARITKTPLYEVNPVLAQALESHTKKTASTKVVEPKKNNFFGGKAGMNAMFGSKEKASKNVTGARTEHMTTSLHGSALIRTITGLLSRFSFTPKVHPGVEAAAKSMKKMYQSGGLKLSLDNQLFFPSFDQISDPKSSFEESPST